MDKAQSGCPVDHGQYQKQSNPEQLQQQQQQQQQCPVDHKSMEKGSSPNSISSPLLEYIFSITGGESKQENVRMVGINPDNNMPAVPEQHKWPGQKLELPTKRIVSSIPKGDFNPPHQQTVQDIKNWVYPRYVVPNIIISFFLLISTLFYFLF